MTVPVARTQIGVPSGSVSIGRPVSQSRPDGRSTARTFRAERLIGGDRRCGTARELRPRCRSPAAHRRSSPRDSAALWSMSDSVGCRPRTIRDVSAASRIFQFADASPDKSDGFARAAHAVAAEQFEVPRDHEAIAAVVPLARANHDRARRCQVRSVVSAAPRPAFSISTRPVMPNSSIARRSTARTSSRLRLRSGIIGFLEERCPSSGSIAKLCGDQARCSGGAAFLSRSLCYDPAHISAGTTSSTALTRANQRARLRTPIAGH